MAAREASLKVTLQRGSFQSGLRTMVSSTVSAGKRMGAAIKGPMTKGLKSAKAELGSLTSGLKRGIGIAASLGGALSVAGLVKDAVALQNTYRNIAFNVNKVAGNTETWESIQETVNGAVDATGRSAEDLAGAFDTVFQATGNLDLAKASLQVVGTTATATGIDVEALGNIAQIANRKFGVGADGMQEAMARFIEKTGVGGASAEEMGNRFALMAGDAARAGLTGKEGISELLGVMLLLDNSVGEKASPALKLLFETLTSGTTQVKRFEKAMGRGVKFGADLTAFDKVKAILTSKKARVEAEAVFTGDARKVFDELAKPFDEAVKAASARNLTSAEKLKLGLAAFDNNIAKASKSTLTFADLQKQANDNMDSDPLIKMNRAFAEIGKAVASPKMIEGMNKLADKMPEFADAVAWAINTFLDNPWTSIATIVGGKIALAFAGSAVSSAIASGVKSMFAAKTIGAAASALPGVAAGAGGLAAGAGAGGLAGLAAPAAVGAAVGGAAFLGTRALIEDTVVEEGLANIGAKLFEAISGSTPKAAGPGINAGLAATGGSSGRARARAESQATKSMESLAKHTAQVAKAMSSIASSASDTSRGPLTPANPTPGSSAVN